MSARIGRLEYKVLGRLFSSENLERDAMALRVKVTVDAFGQGKLCVNNIARVLGQPASAVQRTVGLFPAGQGYLDRALGLVALLAVADQIIDPNRGLGLHIARSASIEVSIFLDQVEGIARHILPLSLDHIDVSKHQNRLGARVRAVEHRQEAPFFWMSLGDEYMHVLVWITGGLQPRRHALRGQCAVAY